MSQPRIEMNAVILPSGKVLAVGGSASDENASTASLNADLYDPATNTFSPAGANAFARLYHSVALLLPDATVWLAGSNPKRGTYEPHMEIYQPAYLFNPDGTLATRPTIASATALFGQGSLAPPVAPQPSMRSLDQIEPRTPILSPPFTINTGGSYYLTGNVIVSNPASRSRNLCSSSSWSA